jgi:acetyl-CoA C-acetyltransferase
MRKVYAVSGGVSKFAKTRPDKTFQAVVKEAYDYAVGDLGLEFSQFNELVDGSVASYFSDHFARQLMAGIMVQDYLGLCPKPGHRVEGGGDRRHLPSGKRGRRLPAVIWTSALRTASRP